MRTKFPRPNELDMMMIRAGWSGTRADLERKARGPAFRRPACRTCRALAMGFHALADWLETRAAIWEARTA